jgi:hypothetical protein
MVTAVGGPFDLGVDEVAYELGPQLLTRSWASPLRPPAPQKNTMGLSDGSSAMRLSRVLTGKFSAP